jgi:hypothetical protein
MDTGRRRIINSKVQKLKIFYVLFRIAGGLNCEILQGFRLKPHLLQSICFAPSVQIGSIKITISANWPPLHGAMSNITVGLSRTVSVVGACGAMSGSHRAKRAALLRRPQACADEVVLREEYRQRKKVILSATVL